MRVHGVRGAFAAVALVLALSGCAGIGGGEVLTLGPDELLEVPCVGVDEVPVEDLDTAEPPDCVPWGAELVFPGGFRMPITEGTASASTTDGGATWAWMDVGAAGVVAARYQGFCEDVQVWGRADAVAKLEGAFGDDLGMC